MNETNGPGAAVPVGHVVRIPTGWMPVTGDVAYHSTRDVDGAIFCPDPSIYTPAVLERGTPILPDEGKAGDIIYGVSPTVDQWSFPLKNNCDVFAKGMQRRFAWLRPHAVPSPPPAPGSDAEHPPEGYRLAHAGDVRLPGYKIWSVNANAWIPGLEVGDAIAPTERCPIANPAAPPQESDKGRDDAGDLRAGLHSSTDRWGSVCKALGIDASASEFAVLAAIQGIKGDLAQARAELQTARDAYAELLQETKLTEEAGGAVARAYRERDEALRELAQVRAALLAYQEAGKVEPDAWAVETANEDLRFWGGNERESAEQVAERYGLTAIPLYQHPPAPADAVTVPREELAKIRERVAWISCQLQVGYSAAIAARELADLLDAPCLDALRSSAQAERAGAADVVTVPREEWEALRALFAAAGRAIHTASTGGRATLEEINDAWAGVCSAQIALRSSAQAGEGGAR